MIGAVIGILTCERASITIQKRALSAAVVSAGGSLKALEDNSQLKPYNSGHAAASAITAVAMAKSGFDGPDDPLGGTAGLLNMMAEMNGTHLNYFLKHLMDMPSSKFISNLTPHADIAIPQ